MTKTAVENTQAGVTLWTRFTAWAVELIGVKLVGNPKHGAVTVVLPNGRSRTLGNPATGSHS
ncbi:MAG TPA: hypothetical protein VGN79_01490, partial [Devosia sp.]|nr:hypothetical protein [Devosia sp.]